MNPAQFRVKARLSPPTDTPASCANNALTRRASGIVGDRQRSRPRAQLSPSRKTPQADDVRRLAQALRAVTQEGSVMTIRLAKPVLADGSPRGRTRLRYEPRPSGRGWLLVLIALLSPLVYVALKLVYWPAVEAPGYILPGTQLHVAAYVPQDHTEYAKPGQKAIVLFPDGARRAARITEVAQEAAPEVPMSNPYGRTVLGVLVRMDFVDAADQLDASNVQAGLPVQIRFPKRWP
jgi:hypothetical protein